MNYAKGKRSFQFSVQWKRMGRQTWGKFPQGRLPIGELEDVKKKLQRTGGDQTVRRPLTLAFLFGRIERGKKASLKPARRIWTFGAHTYT